MHSTGGWAALAAIIVIGPRIGRFGPGAVPIRGHDLPVTTIGVFVLWVGWYGFNGGSTFGLTRDVPSIILNTTLAATFGGLVGMALTWLRDRRPDVVTIMNGSLAGLVGITASANIVRPWRRLSSACRGGVMQVAVVVLERMVDDAVGAVPVHLGAGIWGTLAVALFGDVTRFPLDGRIEQLGIQLVGIAACGVWTFGVSFARALLNRVLPLRVDPEGELAGLNIAEHGATTEITDLLSDIDAQRRRGDFERPVRVEPNTEVGRIAAEYNRVLATIAQRTDSLQFSGGRRPPRTSRRRSTTLSQWRSTRCAGSPAGPSATPSRGSRRSGALVSTGVWHVDDGTRYAAFRAATEAQAITRGSGWPGGGRPANR